VGRLGRPLFRGVAALVVTALIVAACGVLSPPDPRLCSAAQNLSAAMALTATAIEADQVGDLARAQGLATQARSVSELANGLLRGAPDAQKSDPVFQALQLVYLATARAANSLLPAYSNTHGTGPAELAKAGASMAKAREGLPGMCFDIPADVETPGAS
jgi:hypothetical protein